MPREYTVVLYDPFYDTTEQTAVMAEDIDEAIEAARAIAENDDLEVDTVEAPDGETVCFSTGNEFTVVAVTVVHTATGEPQTEVIHALTFEMAIDLAELMFGEGTVVSVSARGRRSWLGR